MEKIIYTIGHSTHSLEEFISILLAYEIQCVADIRGLPGSRKFPWFNKESLEISLAEKGINYHHFIDLGGRRKVHKDSKNTLWHNESFRAYADYMETSTFPLAMNELENLALLETTAIMCAEVLWWRCHRSMVSDYLKVEGWTVRHIMSINKIEEHHYTSPARIKDHQVFYCAEEPSQD